MKAKKDYKAAPPVTGALICEHGHQWNVVDLNPERVTVLCPVCGTNTSIREGLKNGQLG